MIMCKFRQDACDAYCNIAKQYDFCKDEENCPVFKLQEENAELKKNALVLHDYETEKPQKEGECILIIERELCGKKRQIKCLHYAEETNMGFDFITEHKILKWAELPEE